MRVPSLGKVFGRAKALSAGQLADVVTRHARAAVRARAEEMSARRLNLHADDPALLPRAVPGAATTEEAVEELEAAAGRLPLPADTIASSELLARADHICAGLWDVLGHRQVPLGRIPDWHSDFVTGARWDPTVPSGRQPIVRGDGSDIKIPWELSRLQQLPVVAEAFARTSEPRYRDLIALQLRDWIARNPPGDGVNWVCAMEVALRAVSMSWAFERIRRDPAVGIDLRARTLWSLFAHGHYLMGHLEDDAVSPGNHYVADLLGLIWLGTLYPAFLGAAEWRDQGLALLLAHLPHQVLPDGGDGESSTAYHQLVQEMLELVLQILGANRQRVPELRETLDRMGQFTESLRKPNGALPQLGDNDGGRALQLPRPHAPAVLGPSHFPQSGLVCFKRGDLYLLFAATPVGQHGQGGHGHNDKLAIELFYGTDLITDPGSFAYTGDPDSRDAFRATAAHATLQIDDLEQNQIPKDAFSLPEHSHARIVRCEGDGDRFVCEGEHRGFAPYLHRRTVTVEGLTLSIVDTLDRIEGTPQRKSGGEHRLTLRFPLAVGLSAELHPQGLTALRGDHALLSLSCEAATWLIEPGWYAPTYAARVPRSVAVARLRRALPTTITTILKLSASPSTPGPTAPG